MKSVLNVAVAVTRFLGLWAVRRCLSLVPTPRTIHSISVKYDVWRTGRDMRLVVRDLKRLGASKHTPKLSFGRALLGPKTFNDFANAYLDQVESSRTTRNALVRLKQRCQLIYVFCRLSLESILDPLYERARSTWK